MRIIVCIKQVPDTTEVKIDHSTGRLMREGVPSILNPEDGNALESALELKRGLGAELVALSMGPPQAEAALREALALGADRAILLTDRAFGGADTGATAEALGKAVLKIGGYDLILCGRQAIDGDTAQVGPQLAALLGIPQITYAEKIKVADGRVTANRGLEDGYEVIEAPLPALLTVTKEANEPGYPTAVGIIDAFDSLEVETWSAADIGARPEDVGLKGSATKVVKSFTPKPKGRGKKYEGAPDELVPRLVAFLRDKNVISISEGDMAAVEEEAPEKVWTCAAIFERLPSIFKPDKAGDWAAVMEFEISGPGGGTWTMEIGDGKAAAREGKADSPHCVVHADAETWIAVLTEKINGMQAFMSGKLRVDGDVSAMMKMPQVFGRLD